MTGTTLMAFSKVFQDERTIIGQRFDLGAWTIESYPIAGGAKTALTVSPELMDQIIAAWPRLKANVR